MLSISLNYIYLRCPSQLSPFLDVPLVAQVCTVFAFPETKTNPLPTSVREPLLYVEFFEVFGHPDEVMKMYKLRHKLHLGPDGFPHREGTVIPITAVTHAVELIPIYGI